VFDSWLGTATVQQQRKYLTEDEDGLAERHLTVVAVGAVTGKTSDGQDVERRDADSLRRRFRVEPGRLTVLLIGKDGGVKMRSTDPVSRSKIFTLIDSMPMRMQEMSVAASKGGSACDR